MSLKRIYISRPTEIILQHWWDIQDTNNFVYLQKDFDPTVEDHSEEALAVYQSLNDQLIEKHGVSSSYLKILKQQRRYVILMCEAISKDNDYVKWQADKVKRKLDAILDEETEDKREETLITIGKVVYNRPISAMEITLSQYHTHMAHANKVMAAQNREARKRKSKR